MQSNIIPIWLKILISFGVLLFLGCIIRFAHAAFDADLKLFLVWGQCALDKGLGNVYLNYQCQCNYHPLFVHLFTAFVKLSGSLEAAMQHMHWLRWFIFPFDILLAVLVVKMAKFPSKDQQIWAVAGLFALPAWWYNTFVWAQVDAVHCAFCFLALYLIWKKQPVWSLLFYILALNAKLQAIVYLPVLGLCYLINWRKMLFSGRQALIYVGILFVQALIFLPYLLAGTLPSVWHEIIGAVGHHPSITMNAYNIWFILPEHGMLYESDQQPYFGQVSHHAMGFSLFVVSVLIGLLPLFIQSYRCLRTRVNRFPLDCMLLGVVVVSLSFFMFNTQMHERYAIPAMAPMWAYALRNRKAIWVAIALSLAILLNQELVLQYFTKDIISHLRVWQVATAYMYLVSLLAAIYWSFKSMRHAEDQV